MALSDNARGVALMCGSMLAFTLNDTLVKAVLHDGYGLYQVIALRGVGALLGSGGDCLAADRAAGPVACGTGPQVSDLSHCGRNGGDLVFSGCPVAHGAGQPVGHPAIAAAWS